ncbi:MAG: hypothetical protein GF381_04155 [Candidatus Pacebacteria bacterium]|nr:hypothetical protein [Candidatus Paceibacterota bacterium]
MQLDPNWAYAPFNLGLLYVIKGSEQKNEQLYQEGMDWIQFAVENFPNHVDNDHFREHLGVAQTYHQETWGDN